MIAQKVPNFTDCIYQKIYLIIYSIHLDNLSKRLVGGIIINSKYDNNYLLSRIFIVLKTKSLNFLRSRLKATSTLGIFLVTP